MSSVSQYRQPHSVVSLLGTISEFVTSAQLPGTLPKRYKNGDSFRKWVYMARGVNVKKEADTRRSKRLKIKSRHSSYLIVQFEPWTKMTMIYNFSRFYHKDIFTLNIWLLILDLKLSGLFSHKSESYIKLSIHCSFTGPLWCICQDAFYKLSFFFE